MVSNTEGKSEYPQENLNALDWIILRGDMDKVLKTETFTEKFKRKFSENPFVPIGQLFLFIYSLKSWSSALGCGATLAALSYGIWSFRSGNQQMSQYMMRTRVLAQGLTVVALIGGIYLGTTKLK